jgi:hypothetical protein
LRSTALRLASSVPPASSASPASLHRRHQAFGVHHQLARIRQPLLLAGLRRQFGKLGHRVVEKVALGRGTIELGALIVEHRTRLGEPAPGGRHRVGAGSSPAKASSSRRWPATSISARSSCWPWISASSPPELSQQGDAHRLIVDERAAAALGILDAADDDLASGLQPVASSSRRAAWPAGTANAAVTMPRSAPVRTTPACAPAPERQPRASSRIDFPAPVSPVSTVRPARARDRAAR